MLKRLAFAAFLLSLFLIPDLTFAQIDINETGLYQVAEPVYGTNQRNIDLGSYVAFNVIRPLFAISGIVFLVFMIYAGILWMTDQGNSDQVGKAKRILVHATIGLIIMIGAYAITNLVLTALTGGDITNLE